MRAAIRIAWRETRAAWPRLLPLLLCLAVGVGAVSTVGSFAASVRAAVAAKTRGLLAADLQLSGSAPIDRATFPTLATLEREGGATTTITEFLSVLTPVGEEGSVLCEVKAVGPGYPLVGELTMSDGTPVRGLPAGDAVLVEPSLLARLGVAVGDRLTFGTTTVRIAGVLGAEPDRSLAAVSLGPRLLVDDALLPTTGLLERGSRATHRLAVRLPPGATQAGASAALAREGRETTVTIRTADETQSNLRQAIDRLERTLVTVALAVLLLAGAGIALTVRIHVLQRLDALAILRAIGASRAVLTTAVLLQALGLGVIGSAVGVALGLAGARVFPVLVARLLPEGFVPVVSWEAAAEGAFIGLATTITFALAPSLLASRVSPLAVLRRSPTPLVVARRPAELALFGAVVLGFLATLAEVIGTWQWAIGLGAALIGLMSLLTLVSRGLLALLRWGARRSGRFTLREGLLHPTRAPRATATVLTTLTLGGLLIGTVGLVERNLLASLTTALEEERPNVYVVGVRPEQREAVERVVGRPVPFEPVVRARVYAVDDRRVERNAAPSDDGRRSQAGREFGITSRREVVATERLTSGRWWAEDAVSTPEVSVEDELAQELGARIGSTITFDVLGTRLAARVTSTRAVDWESGRPNYVFVLSPGALDGAPTTYFLALQVPQGEVAALQAALAREVPNASAFDVSLALDIVRDVLSQIVAVIEFLASLVVAVGLVLLAGMVLSTRAARVRETAILRTVGATARQVRRMLLVEYGVVGLTSGLLAVLLAEAVSWGVTTQLLELTWRPFLAHAGGGVLVFVLLSAGVGTLAALPILRATPLSVLRGE